MTRRELRRMRLHIIRKNDVYVYYSSFRLIPQVLIKLYNYLIDFKMIKELKSN